MTSTLQKTPKSPLGELRDLRRQGIAGNLPAILAILAALKDPLDIEAAGGLLSAAAKTESFAELPGLRIQRIAILGSSTLDNLPNILTALLLRDGIAPIITTTDFNQWRFEVMSGAPTLRAAEPRLIACLLDETVIFDGLTDMRAVDPIEERCAAFAQEIEEWVKRCQSETPGRIILNTIPLSPLRSAHLIDYQSKARLSAAWARMNASILDLATHHQGVTVLDANIIAAQSDRLFASHRMRLAAAHAFAPSFLYHYAEELTRIARADLGLAKKCLVLDLDNTLWGGVVGDIGVGGLALGRAWPGSPYTEVQELARDYAAQGVLLTVCSKNDDSVAREALATHPEMVLRPDDFSIITANWEPKAQNVRQQIKTLNIGADSLVFLDDHSVERDAMRSFLPEVTTIELPEDPALFAVTLALEGRFNLISLTEEDRARTSLYRAQAARAEAAVSMSLEDYLASLESRLEIEPLNPLNVTRITQLFAKTNQFNLTGRRYTEDQLLDPALRVYGARLSDRFGDNGLIAAIALADQPDGTCLIDNAVISCRVFSRGVEEALMAVILREAKTRGASTVRGHFVPTAKNGRFAGFYPTMGFETDDTGFRHDLAEILDIPSWITLVVSEGDKYAA